MTLSPKKLGFLFASTAALCFSGKAILAKLSFAVQPDLTPSHLLFLRMLVAVPLYAILLLWYVKKHEIVLVWSDVVKAGLLGLLGFYVSAMLDFAGLQRISAGLERVILFTYPIWVLLLGAVFFKKRITKIQWGAQILAWVGIFLCFSSELFQTNFGQENLWWGALFILSCSLTFAIYLLLAAPVMKRMGTISFISIAQLSAGIAILVQVLLEGNLHKIASTSTNLWLLSLLMGLVATFLPNILNTAAVNQIGPANMAIVNSIGPAATIVLELLILREPTSGLEVLGMVLVIFGVLTLLKE